MDPEKECDNLRKALNTPWLPPRKQPFALKFLDKPASDDFLSHELDEFKPNVLHFVGHGTYSPPNEAQPDQAGEFQLVMADNDNFATPQNAAHLATLLRGSDPHGRPHLRAVVIAACNSGAPAVGRGMTGLAPELLKGNVAAALVMQHPVAMETAQRFALQFYGALRDGKPLDYAVNLARKILWLDDSAPT